MSGPKITLNDRFDLSKDQVLLNGTQALVRLMLMQKARDTAAGVNTAGLVTGYRGSPLGAVDMWMERAGKVLAASDIVFQAGLNEDLAATALWGAQQAELRGEGKFDGVFGLWYGKGPGVDRTGDVMRHANMAGTSRFGGVLMAMGDDHTGESSTVLHQSDGALIDAYMPVLSPAGVQEILDFGIYGYGLSRFASVWAGLKLMKDTVEVTSVVDGRADRLALVTPEVEMPEGGVNIRLVDDRIVQEARLLTVKRPLMEAYARANRIDQRVWGAPGAKIGFVAAGKTWLDLTHALSLLGIDAARAAELGITTYKVGQVWPLDQASFEEVAAGLDLIVVVEEKKKLLEGQIKEALFHKRRDLRVYGAETDRGEALFTSAYALDPIEIAEALGRILIEEGRGSEALEGALARLKAAQQANNAEGIAARLPYFCAGCPHNSSTKVPEGSRAYAGIGCHFMAQWMDRKTLGFTHMGGEGASWIGEAPFSTTEHVFQNIGDGTYNHSGIMAIRAAVAANTTMTYKILYNDAVAMTGGQANEGGLDAPKIAREMVAAGARKVVLVYDPNEGLELSAFPAEVERRTRDELITVEEELRGIKGVTVLLYVQTCAAEKRRRRKRGRYPDPDKRVFINTDVCEGCGDCGVQSNCVAITPVETEFGRKRAIDQSACNKDFSCVNGLCPSFVTVSGGTPRKAAQTAHELPEVPTPALPAINGTHNTVITGVGGTGVVTIGAILAQAAHLDGKGASMMEMAGLAQKGGAVLVHLRVAERPEDISAIRVAIGEADALIGGELVVSASPATLGLTTTGSTKAVVDSRETVTGDFTRNTEFRIPGERLSLAIEARLKEGAHLFDASALAETLLGDRIFSNMLVLGGAWQRGLVPISHGALMEAIALNGQAVERNKRAFEIGRWAVEHPGAAAALVTPAGGAEEKSLDERIDLRAALLTAYEGAGLADTYRAAVMRFAEGALREAAALGYHKVLYIKDEYEVARLHQATREKAAEVFEGDLRLTYHLAPPILAKAGADGRPQKRAFGPWMARGFALLARLKPLRGTAFDVFGRDHDRRAERALIARYEADMDEVLALGALDGARAALAIELLRLPLSYRGYGAVKRAAMAAGAARREAILAELRAGPNAMAAE